VERARRVQRRRRRITTRRLRPSTLPESSHNRRSEVVRHGRQGGSRDSDFYDGDPNSPTNRVRDAEKRQRSAMSTAPTSIAAISVTEYSARITRALRTIGGGVVEGEVQEPKITPKGMLFFALTDGIATLDCKVFPAQLRRLEHHPRHGDLVQVRVDRPDLWAKAGKLHVIVSEVRLAGEGELLRRREELLSRLTAEGLCDSARRKPLPAFPRAVGIIAGKDSKGWRDAVKALQDRFPPVHLVTCAALVQGVHAPLDVIDALAHLDAHPLVDVIVIARGGGPVQDLVAFDDERLCRAVFACGTPVIAAIGHTDNIPVCNHVAWASDTPSRSPELAVPSVDALRRQLQLAGAQLAPARARVGAVAERVASVRLDGAGVLRARQLEVSGAAGALRDAEHEFFAACDTGLAHVREALAAVPGRIPDTANLAALAGRLDTHAFAFFSVRAESVRETADFYAPVTAGLNTRAERVRETAGELRTVRPALQARADAVARLAPAAQTVVIRLATCANNTGEQGSRLTAGIRKELADSLYNYHRALPRHTGAIRDAALRRLQAEDHHLDDVVARADDGARRRLTDASRDLDHVGTLLTASDPRRRGWVLPTDDAGAVVRSVHKLAIGERLNLSFHDGTASAVIDDVPNQEEP
jgi:exodeoxyribonuclease VII large subunit